MDFQCLFDILPYQQAQYPTAVALARKDGLHWKTFSTAECLEQVQKVSAGALQLGLKRGDKVAIIADQGSPEWHFIDFGMLQVGVVVLTIYANLSDKALLHVLHQSGIKYCFVQDRAIYLRVQHIQSNIVGLKQIYTLTKTADLPHWEEVLIAPTAYQLQQIHALRAVIHEEDLATIIYTPGTTGLPKGVMLSHKNLVTSIRLMLAHTSINCDKAAISVLPISHIFQRLLSLVYIVAGVSIYYANESEQLLSDFQEIRPHYIAIMPNTLKRMYDRILKRGDFLSPTRKKLLHWSLKVGEEYPEQGISFFYWIKLQLASLFTYRRWRKLSGKRLEEIIVGMDVAPIHLLKLPIAAGFNLKEIYGLTETTSIISINKFNAGSYHFGTVGKKMLDVRVKMDTSQSGEIWVKGENVMLGYYQLDESDSNSLKADGWFKTGDKGQINQNQFLTLVGREDFIFETSSGRLVSAQQIERYFLNTPYIKQCLLTGIDRSHLSLLVVPAFAMLKKWCQENEIDWTNFQSLVAHPKVDQLFKTLINNINKLLQEDTRITSFYLLYQEWNVENGLCTPTGKVNRALIQTKFRREIASMYDDL